MQSETIAVCLLAFGLCRSGQCGLLFHRVYRPRDGYCYSRRLMVFSRPRGLWAPMRYPVLSGSPLLIFRCVGEILEAWRYPVLMFSQELRLES